MLWFDFCFTIVSTSRYLTEQYQLETGIVRTGIHLTRGLGSIKGFAYTHLQPKPLLPHMRFWRTIAQTRRTDFWAQTDSCSSSGNMGVFRNTFAAALLDFPKGKLGSTEMAEILISAQGKRSMEEKQRNSIHSCFSFQGTKAFSFLRFLHGTKIY